MTNEMTDGAEAGKRAKTEPDGLAALMQYGSDGEEGENEKGVDDGAGDGVQAGPSVPQTAEEKQALYLKHKEQASCKHTHRHKADTNAIFLFVGQQTKQACGFCHRPPYRDMHC